MTAALKILFVVGQCVRVLHTDPWQAPTYRIEEIGRYSYWVTKIPSPHENAWLSEEGVIPFEEQKEYEKVECGKLKTEETK